MIKQNQRILNMIHLLSDAFLTVLAYFAAIGIRFGMMDGTWSINLRSMEYMQLLALYCGAELILFYMLRVYVPQHHDHRCGAPPENRAPGTGPLELHNQHYVVEIKNGRPVAARKVRKNKTLLPAFSK